MCFYKRKFIQDFKFAKQWDELGLSDDDMNELESVLLENPQIGDIVPGTGNIRKMRIPFKNKGKRGGARVCYVDFVVYDTIYLLSVYSKNEQTDLIKSQYDDLVESVKSIENMLRKQSKGGNCQ